MLQDFDIKNTVEDIQNFKRLQEEYGRVQKALSEITDLKHRVESEKSKLEETRAKALLSRNTSSIFSRIASIFHRGEYYRANAAIAEQEKKLEKLGEEYLRLTSEESKLEEGKTLLGTQMESIKIPKCVETIDGNLVIRDQGGSYGFVSTDGKIPTNQRVLVRCVNHFPENGMMLSTYDAGVIGSTTVTYNGVSKQIQALNHRHEVHFTINNRVESTGDGTGNWDNPKYIIIDRYDLHEGEMEVSQQSDAWTKGTSMQLSKDAVIMVNLEDKATLPEEAEKYNIIYYQGNATRCLRNFLGMNEYDVWKTEKNSASHANSARILQEDGCNHRDLAINFVRDNSHFSKVPIILSAEDVAQITDVGIQIRVSYILSPKQSTLCRTKSKIAEEQSIQYEKIANFIVGSGLKRTKDGKYTFKSDEEILADIEEIRSNTDVISNCVDLDLIYEIFQMQQELAKQYKDAPLPSIESLQTMTLQELYKFKNQLACQAAQQVFNGREERMVGDGEHIILQKPIRYQSPDDCPKDRTTNR